MIGTFLIAFTLSIDALGIGLSYGVRKIKIPILAKLIIFFMAFLIMTLSVLFGSLITAIVPPWVAKYVGIAILMALGFWIISQSFKENEEVPADKENKTILSLLIKSMGITITIMRTPAKGDLDQNNIIEPMEAFYLGCALSIDSIGVGIASAAIGLTSFIMPLLAGIFQVSFLSLGLFAGKKLSAVFGESKIWSRISGFILIFIAVLKIFY